MQADKWGLKNAYFCYIVNVWVIIDPHWNLELYVTCIAALHSIVIIDPHWNLEAKDSPVDQNQLAVIIDPHWNLEYEYKILNLTYIQ